VKVAWDAVVAGVPIAVNILLLLASHNTVRTLTASAAAADSSVTDVVSAVGFPRVPAVVMVSAVAGAPLLICCSYCC
jgi:hypothetical protein